MLKNVLVMIRFRLLVCLVIMGISQVRANDAEDTYDLSCALMNFNFYNEVDFEGMVQEYYLSDLNINSYLIPMKNSDDLVVAVKRANVLKPVIFLNLGSDKVIYKDINNRKTVISYTIEEANNSFKITDFKYIKKNDSQSGLKASAGGCTGGSVNECIGIELSSCLSDPICSNICNFRYETCIINTIGACIFFCGAESYDE